MKANVIHEASSETVELGTLSEGDWFRTNEDNIYMVLREEDSYNDITVWNFKDSRNYLFPDNMDVVPICVDITWKDM